MFGRATITLGIGPYSKLSSLYFTMGRSCPSKLSLPMGDLADSGPHLIHGSLGPPESSTQTVSRSLNPFFQRS